MAFSEILKLALDTLKANKLRAGLTLLGIVIGVFSIIAIMTLLGALQSGIETGLTALGTNTFQIQKFPALQVGGPGGRSSKYRLRPDITYDQGVRLKSMVPLAKSVSLEFYEFNKTFKYGANVTNPNMYIGGIVPDFLPANGYTIKEGRFFTEREIQNPGNIAVVGMDVVDKLFPFESPIGKKFLMDNNEFTIIGIFESKGQSFGQSQDNFAAIPITKFMQIYSVKDKSINIAIEAPSKEMFDATMEQSIAALRVIRKDKPGEDNSFEIYSNDSLIGQVNSFTAYFKYGAGFISFISLLAAGIGIMNIMLVSVTERTREIGIRKAIGAKSKVILMQFLTEAVILCNLGGVIGIILGIIGGNIVGIFLQAQVIIPYDWAIIGLIVCSLVGIIFGVYPAYKAARLNPIDALRYE